MKQKDIIKLIDTIVLNKEMYSLLYYDNNTINDIEYYIKNIIFSIVCLALITYILIKIINLFSKTIPQLNKMIYDLDKKLTSKIQELEEMKQLDENTSNQLKMSMSKIQQLEDNIVLLESRLESIMYERINDIINRLSLVETNILTNKNLIERHTTEIAYSKHNHKETLDNMELFCERMYDFKIEFVKEITDLKCCNEEKMSLIKAYNKDAMYKTELLNDKLTAITSGYDDTLKDMLHTMNTMYNSQISLKTEFNEKVNVVGIGVYDDCPHKPIIINSNTSVFYHIIRDYHGLSLDLHSLKFLPMLKTIDLSSLYRGTSMVYVSELSNVLDKVDQHRNWSAYSSIRDIRDFPLLFQIEGSKKVIEYIRSIRPDIVLTWNNITI